jgi:lambda repressor-like predicted transcriptional regulator
MNMGGRIRARLSELGQSIAWLSRSSGVPLATISIAIQRDSKRSEYSTPLAVALGVTEGWLTTGRGDKLRGGTIGSPVTAATTAALERAQEIDGVELTKEAIQLAKAWMDLPRNVRDEYKRKIETEALRHTSVVLDRQLDQLAAPGTAPHARARKKKTTTGTQ